MTGFGGTSSSLLWQPFPGLVPLSGNLKELGLWLRHILILAMITEVLNHDKLRNWKQSHLHSSLQAAVIKVVLGQRFPTQKESYPAGKVFLQKKESYPGSKLPDFCSFSFSHRKRKRSVPLGSLHAWAFCRCREIKMDSQPSFSFVIARGTQVLNLSSFTCPAILKAPIFQYCFLAPENRLTNHPNYQKNVMREIS